MLQFQYQLSLKYLQTQHQLFGDCFKVILGGLIRSIEIIDNILPQRLKQLIDCPSHRGSH